MNLIESEARIMNKCLRDLTPRELKIYQDISKRRLNRELDEIRKIYHSGGDLTGFDSIKVSAALGFIPKEYNIGNYEQK